MFNCANVPDDEDDDDDDELLTGLISTPWLLGLSLDIAVLV